MNKYILLLLSFIFILPVYSLDDFKASSYIAWDKGEIIIDLVFNVSSDLTPKTRFEAEQLASENISEVFMDSIMDFTVDSFYTINELIKDDYNLIVNLKAISENGIRGPAYYSLDFSSIIVSYNYPIFGNNGLIVPLIKHERAFPLPRVLGFSPTEDFTGIVIYSKGMYNTIGPSEDTEIKPALFPKIYDDEMNLVLEKEMCSPDALKEWGMTAYSTNLDIEQYEYRVGIKPLKIMAKMVYGVNNTDIIISSLNASQILTSDKNRELLVNGNMLIIYEDF